MVKIRKFQCDDKQSIAKIYLNCRLATFRWVPKEQFKIEDFDKDTDGEVILVATEEAKPIGFISLWMQDNFIHHLFVETSHQSAGVGMQLLKEGLSLLELPARLKCVVQNTRACSFYEKAGWKIEGTTRDGPMGAYHTYVLGK